MNSILKFIKIIKSVKAEQLGSDTMDGDISTEEFGLLASVHFPLLGLITWLHFLTPAIISCGCEIKFQPMEEELK